jgi:PAS domain-containing protein
MIKSVLLGVTVALALPIAGAAYFFAQRWMVRNAPKSAFAHQGQAVGLGFVAGRFVELLIWGVLAGIVVAAIMHFAKLGRSGTLHNAIWLTASVLRMINRITVEDSRIGMEEVHLWRDRYRVLFDRNVAGIILTNAKGRIMDCNESCARIFWFDSRKQCLGLLF